MRQGRGSGRISASPDDGCVKPLAHRSWFHANSPKPSQKAFTMMSYNILSDKLLYENDYLYAGCDRKVVKWKYRLKKVFAEIKHYAPAILCVQEVDKEHWPSFEEKLEAMGFEGYFCGRTGPKPDGCALFWCAYIKCHGATCAGQQRHIL